MATRRPKVPNAHYGAAPTRPKETAPTPEKTVHEAPASRTVNPRTPVSQGAAQRSATPSSHRNPTSTPRPAGAPNASESPLADTPVPARTFNGRLLVLGLAMVVLTLLLAPNVHTFLGQRSEIAALKQDIAAKSAQQAGLQSELARWDDPAYVKQQARDRVSMLMPGETGYWVYGANGVDEEDSSVNSAGSTTSAAKATTVTHEPWVSGLWDAINKSAEVKAAPAQVK